MSVRWFLIHTTAALRNELTSAAAPLCELAAAVDAPDVQKEALWAIANLCAEEPLRKQLVKAGCVEPAVKALQQNDREFQFIALKIIASLSESGKWMDVYDAVTQARAEDMRFLLLKWTVLKDVLAILHSMHVPVDMRALCVSICRWFSETESTHEQLLKYGGGRVLLPMALDEQAEKHTRDDALAAVANMMVSGVDPCAVRELMNVKMSCAL